MQAAPRIRPVHVCLATKATVKEAVNGMLAAGCEIEGSLSAGFLTIRDEGTVVYRALEKGSRQPWIVSCFNGPRVSWKQD